MNLSNNKGQNQFKIEPFKGEILHPSLDFKNGVLIYGFFYTSKERKRKPIFLISHNNEILMTEKDTFEINEKRYIIDLKGRELADLEERWGCDNLQKFYDEYYQGKTHISLEPRELLNKIEELSKKYYEVRKEIDYSINSAYIIGTYVFPIFSKFPFLHFKGVKGSGKSQVLKFLKQVCFNARKSRPSMPALVDTVDSLRGTYLIDQADYLKRRGNEDLLDVLADSYRKGGGKRAFIQFDQYKRRGISEPDAYSPKVFASIEELPEDLRDRCIVIPLIKSRKNFPEPDDESENWKEIRGELYKFGVLNFGLIKSLYDALSVSYRIDPKMTGRELDLWLPFEIIFKVCSFENIEEAKNRFKQLYGFSQYEANDLEKEVIKIVASSFTLNESQKILSLKEIYNKIPDELWINPSLTTRQKETRIGLIIRKFNLATEKKRTSEGISYLFEKDNVLDVKSQYVGENGI